MYSFEIDLAHNDREVYETLKLSVAMHPSETVEYMLTRTLAYCLEWEESLSFTKGLGDSEEPAIWAHHPDGRVKTWIEVGVPQAEKLHKAAKLAERVAVYTHKPPAILMQQLAGKRIHRASQIPVYYLGAELSRDLSGLVERRTIFSMSVSEGHIYLNVGGRNLFACIEEHRLV